MQLSESTIFCMQLTCNPTQFFFVTQLGLKYQKNYYFFMLIFIILKDIKIVIKNTKHQFIIIVEILVHKKYLCHLRGVNEYLEKKYHI